MKAYRTTIVESERGWGTQIDDYMICLTRENAREFKEKFNSDITDYVPDWYLIATDIVEIDVTEKQYAFLQSLTNERFFLSEFPNFFKDENIQ